MQTVRVKLNPAYQPKPPGVGTNLKHAIHAVVDVLPIPAKAKQAIKECGGCHKRENWLNEQQRRLAERRARRANGRPPDAG